MERSWKVHAASLKAKVALAAVTESETMSELVFRHKVQATQIHE